MAMKHAVLCQSLLITLTFCGPAIAAPFDAQAVNTASFEGLPTEAPPQKPNEPDARIVRLQILLDRAGASPGVIDGYLGSNLIKAIAGFEALRGLPVDGKLDPEALRGLMDDVPAVQAYAITADDAKDLVDSIPKDYAEQAKMERLGYTSVAEKLGERFHMDIGLLKALNPTAAFAPGETIAVAIPGSAKTGAVKTIEVRRRSGEAFAFAEGGSLLAVYPATIGSEGSPSPTGTHKIQGVSRMPTYTYNPKINFQQGGNKKVLQLAGGPNGPVGTVWIDLTEPTYGIHGTPEPELIDKVGSHGCVRLTNWDVEELAGMVKPGVIVKFVD
ncbi:L,D-transpeptidase [Neorhizobium galegae]|uniref:L,D-transpeptidase family protein n=1 Tax=Neorhizobium galegae TaxID=399 RepID=UPI0006216F27|nr:L,D-transpeptidase [Neorhizobium galegae]MCQ1775639.1 L,D-transpeptidase [Neorhizobium galegae]MCQ1798092.1 L,D-transpeptidase [Neorhizobium galegae]CDZ29120.1 ErfK/YbiS/YcfS/YnhG family protein [Neorhizobium galegae bv. officinalis]